MIEANVPDTRRLVPDGFHVDGVSGPLRSQLGNFELQCENSRQLNLCLKAQHSFRLVSCQKLHVFRCKNVTGHDRHWLVYTAFCHVVGNVKFSQHNPSEHQTWREEEWLSEAEKSSLVWLAWVKRQPSARASISEEVNCVITSPWRCLSFFVSLPDSTFLSEEQLPGSGVKEHQLFPDKLQQTGRLELEGQSCLDRAKRWMSFLIPVCVTTS